MFESLTKREKLMDIFNKRTPKYFQIYELLLDDIRTGKYSEGDRFPSDTELVARYRVSRGTIRESLKLLFQQGYLVREQGRGTFVTYRKIQQDPDMLIGFSELMRRNKMMPSARIIEKKVIAPTDYLKELMLLDPHEQVVRIIRLRLGDNHPLIIERSFFNHTLFSPLLDLDLEQNSIYSLLYRYTYIRLGDASQRIEAISAGESERDLLGVSVGTPLLLIKRLIKTSANEIFQYSEDVYRSDRISFGTRTAPYEQNHDLQGLPLDLTTNNWL